MEIGQIVEFAFEDERRFADGGSSSPAVIQEVDEYSMLVLVTPILGEPFSERIYFPDE
ncbi:hypothetical protein [Pseudomonas sp. FSL W7-0098]|uniref:hypothetical protein n=1 Tax=Pseudomonas sp. FSL W7-0098 TaxID=2496120 RepID=UPI0015AC1C04|nr:hypothetical protein [Pseudomonas sp. FSL W7-0098]